MKPTTMTTLLALLAALLLALPASADDATDSDTDFGEIVDVELVNVEVWVTDKDGQPVEGLPAEAFEIKEDRGKIDLAFFAEVRGGRQADLSTETVAAVEREASSAGSAVQPIEAEAEPSDSGHMVIYFDDLHLSKNGRLGAVDELRALLDAPNVDPARILVLRQDLSIYVEAPFGSTREQLEGTFDRLVDPRTGPSQEADRKAALRYLETEWRVASQLAASNPTGGGTEAGCGTFLNRILPYIENESRRWQGKINVSLEHLHATAGFLSAVPGVKSLVYVADSLETTPGSSLTAFVSGVCQTSVLGRRKPDTAGDLNEAFRRLSRDAAANRVTFYGLQAGGMRSTTALSAENDVLDLRSSNRHQMELRIAERAGMQYLAKETGGRVVFNQNNLTNAALSIAEDTSSYYSLAYAPDHTGEGREHKIRIRLQGEYDRRGLRVRHRRGYQHKQPETRLAEKLQAALFMGFGENPMSIRLGAGTPAPSALANQPDFHVPLHIYVPVKSVTFVPTGAASEARIFVQIAWRGTEGGQPQVTHKTWTIRGPAAEDATFDLKMDLKMAGGLSTVAVAVRDELSREISFVSTSVALPTDDQVAQAASP